MSAPNNAPASQRSSLLTRILIGVLVTLAIGIVVVMSVFSFGTAHGDEFNPGTFERRTFMYYQLPIINLKVSPVWRNSRTNGLATDVAKLSSFKKQPNRSWDLVSLSYAGRLISEGDASILCAYLEDEEPWQKWTKDNPQLAGILWSTVAQLARDRMYILIPHALELAKTAEDSVEFRKALHADVADRFQRLAEREAELGKHDEAVIMLDLAASYTPNDEAIAAARKVSFDELTDEQKQQIANWSAERAKEATAVDETSETKEPESKDLPAEKPLADDATT